MIQLTICRISVGLVFFILFMGVTMVETADAYVGPGAGLSVIGTVLALVAAFFLAIIGFIWYPVKRLLQKRNGAAAHSDTTAAEK